MSAATTPLAREVPAAAPDALDACLGLLLEAAGAADDLGLPTTAVREAHAGRPFVSRLA